MTLHSSNFSIHDSALPVAFIRHKLHPAIAAVFFPFCETLPLAQVAILQSEIKTYQFAIRLAAQRNEFLDHSLVEQIASDLLALLERYATFDPVQQGLLVGAVRYFIAQEDEEHDFNSMFGFEDDYLITQLVSAVLAPNSF